MFRSAIPADMPAGPFMLDQLAESLLFVQCNRNGQIADALTGRQNRAAEITPPTH
jgi:hypothetical protein